MQLWLDSPPVWHRIDKFLPKHLIAFVDEHYSRQTPGSNQILAPGETLLMATADDGAVWGVVHNFDPGQDDTRRWRNTIFRRGGGLACLGPDRRGDEAHARVLAPCLRSLAGCPANKRSQRGEGAAQARSGSLLPQSGMGVVVARQAARVHRAGRACAAQHSGSGA